jgi:cytoskeletal protein RodZ
METIGQYLRSVRLDKGISMERISDHTKIKIRFLECIENDQLAQVGEFGYARAMVVTFARDIGADIRKVCEMYDRKYDHETPEMFSATPVNTLQRRFMFSHRTVYLILLAVFLAVLAFVVIRLYSNGTLTMPHNFLKTEMNKSDSLQSVKPDPAPITTPAATDPAPRDTTDHVNDLIFKGKNSPMNYRDH